MFTVRKASTLGGPPPRAVESGRALILRNHQSLREKQGTGWHRWEIAQENGCCQVSLVRFPAENPSCAAGTNFLAHKLRIGKTCGVIAAYVVGVAGAEPLPAPTSVVYATFS